MEQLTGLVIVGVATLLNAFFAGMETGVTSARSVSIAHRARTSLWARWADRLMRRREAAIVAAVVGNNVSVVVGSAAATAICVAYFGSRGEWIAAAAMSLLTVVVGEVLPKAIYRAQPERLVIASTPLFLPLEWLLFPLRWLALGAARLTLALFGLHDTHAAEQFSREAVRASFERTLRHADEEEMLHRFLGNIARPVIEVATPLARVATLRAQDTVADAIARVRETGHSRLPVLDADGEMRGLVLFRDLLDADPEQALGEIERELTLLSAQMGLDEAIVALTGRSHSLAAVVDAAGRVIAVVTLEDILAVLLGDFQPESEVERVVHESEFTTEEMFGKRGPAGLVRGTVRE